MCISPDDVQIVNTDDYYADVTQTLASLPKVGVPLLDSAKASLDNIQRMLYSASAFANLLKASAPEEILQAVLTDDQNSKLAEGALRLMTKKDGSLLANLVNPQTGKIVHNVSLKNTKITPEISQAMTSYATQMQMAQIAEQIHIIQLAVEEVRVGLEYDRLATAYSCQQKLLLTLQMRNLELKTEALLRIALDAEESRNLLMQSQSINIAFLKNEPESFWNKFLSKTTPEKVDKRINELRESLCALNMVSFVEAIAYMELGEIEVAQQSLQYYAEYIKKTYLDVKGLVQRLDMMDPSPKNYWSKTLPDIKRRIQALPLYNQGEIMEGEGYENQKV